MIDYIVWFYWTSCLLFNATFMWYDSKNGCTIGDIVMTLLISLIPLVNTFGVFWILNEEGVYSKAIFKRSTK